MKLYSVWIWAAQGVHPRLSRSRHHDNTRSRQHDFCVAPLKEASELNKKTYPKKYSRTFWNIPGFWPLCWGWKSYTPKIFQNILKYTQRIFQFWPSSSRVLSRTEFSSLSQSFCGLWPAVKLRLRVPLSQNRRKTYSMLRIFMLWMQKCHSQIAASHHVKVKVTIFQFVFAEHHYNFHFMWKIEKKVAKRSCLVISLNFHNHITVTTDDFKCTCRPQVCVLGLHGTSTGNRLVPVRVRRLASRGRAPASARRRLHGDAAEKGT